MNIQAMAVLLCVAVLMARPCAAATPEQVFDLASRSVVTVQAIDAGGRIVGRGSGVAMNRDIVITNCHVVGRGRTFFAAYARKRVPANVIAYDAERDLCALHVRGLNVVPARTTGARGPRVGQRVYAIGTPEGFDLTFSEGLISGVRESDVGPYLQISAPISEGSSGGGLFDDSGRLIGIVSFSFAAGQNLNFVLPVAHAVELAAKAANTPARPVLLPPELTRHWRRPMLR